MNTIKTKEINNIFQIVLPNKTDTDIIVINASHKSVELLDAWKTATSNMLYIIELIESWMMANETWYIRPDIIEKIPEERLEIICEDIRYWLGEHSLWEFYDMSIFDGLRQKYIDIYMGDGNLAEEYVEKERQKFVPQKRINKAQREQNMRGLMGEYKNIYNCIKDYADILAVITFSGAIGFFAPTECISPDESVFFRKVDKISVIFGENME